MQRKFVSVPYPPDVYNGSIHKLSVSCPKLPRHPAHSPRSDHPNRATVKRQSHQTNFEVTATQDFLLLGEATWIAYASSGVLPDPGHAERCSRCYVSPRRRLESKRAESTRLLDHHMPNERRRCQRTSSNSSALSNALAAQRENPL